MPEPRNPNRRASHIPDAFREHHGEGAQATCPICKNDVPNGKLGEHLRDHFDD